MSESDLPELLRQIRQAAADACVFVEGMEQDDFIDDKRTHQAVVMSLMIIGEAVARTANRHPDFVSAHPEIPWREMRGLRNRIAHGYFDVDLGIVWDTVRKDLPDLLNKLAELNR